METVLEEQRRLHEEKERLVEAMTKEMVRKKASHREQINSDHLIKYFLDKYIHTTTNLFNLIEDKDGARKKEIQSLSGPNEFSEFYSRLKAIIQYHKKPVNGVENPVNVPMSIEFENMLKSIQDADDELSTIVTFTDEEGYGKFLDLNEIYQKYVNLKSIERVDYLKYLSQYDHLFSIPKDKKVNQEYKRYLESLNDYLSDYIKRVKPLYDIDSELAAAVIEFEKKWEEGTFPGWQKETTGALTKSGAYLDLTPYSSAAELASLGLDRLKSALMALGLKCGGTLNERANRLFQTKGKRLQDLDPNLFAKADSTTKKQRVYRKAQRNRRDRSENISPKRSSHRTAFKLH